MQAFKNPANNGPTATYSWTAPQRITHVMVEMWGGGGGGGPFGGGGGAGYSRNIISVSPGAVYTINVGGGGLSFIPFGRDSTDGGWSSMTVDGNSLIDAAGGSRGYDVFKGFGRCGDGSPISGCGADADSGGGGGGAAFGAFFCPNGFQTGKGGSILNGGFPGYVLLVW